MTNKIEYVRFLNQDEISRYLQNKKATYIQKKIEVNIAIQQNDILLIKEYEKFEIEIIEKYENNLKEFRRNEALWKDKKCKCGVKLRFYTRSNFWGCPDYTNLEEEHITFKEDKQQKEKFDYDFSNVKVRLDKDWCSIIIKRLGLITKVTAKELLLFYQSIGFDDLREKYDYKSTLTTISTYEYANKKSKKEEEIVRDFLSKNFRVLSQPYVEYKFVDQQKKICIPDLIVSNNDQVFIIEIKTHNFYINEEQLQLYYNLISHCQAISNDRRNLYSIFVVNEIFESEYTNENAILINDLVKLKSKQEIIEFLQQNKFQ